MPPSTAKTFQEDRRKRRSERHDEAMAYYLDSLREAQAIEAVGVATEDGLLVAGSGPVDLEALAAYGAASADHARRLGDAPLHVYPFEAAGTVLLLVSAGKAVTGRGAPERLARILEA